MNGAIDDLAGLKKLLAALDSGETAIMIRHENVTKHWVAALKHEIKVLESRIAELKTSHAQKS